MNRLYFDILQSLFVLKNNVSVNKTFCRFQVKTTLKNRSLLIELLNLSPTPIKYLYSNMYYVIESLGFTHISCINSPTPSLPKTSPTVSHNVRIFRRLPSPPTWSRSKLTLTTRASVYLSWLRTVERLL